MNGSLSSTLGKGTPGLSDEQFRRGIIQSRETKRPIRTLVEIDERANPEDDAVEKVL